MGRGLLVLLAAGVVLATGPARVRATAFPYGPYAQPVMVYPSPGDRYEQRLTQISFRGIPPGEIGSLQVVGSESGMHTGYLEADSDGAGGSFIPNHPFIPGETVTVTTGLNIIGGHGGSFSFEIDHPRPVPVVAPLHNAIAPHDLQHFYSEPGLVPAALRVTEDRAPAFDGDIFVAPEFGPAENGPMILDPTGRLIWFRPFPIGRRTMVTDFRAQRLDGQPVLTWWQGNSNEGTGRGDGIIFNDHYKKIATVHAGNGLMMDLHEFLLTNSGDAYILAVAPVHLPHLRRTVNNDVVQEIDLKTGLVLFQWDALDHIPLSDSVKFGRDHSGQLFDPYHLNSISLDRSGNLIVSSRNTNAVFGIDRATGEIIWQLGGRHSSLRLGSGVQTAFQHDAVMQPDGRLTIFDDGAGPPTVHPASRGLEVALDFGGHRAVLVHQWFHSPNLSSNFEGSVQRLPSGNTFIGWGQQPYFSEVGVDGRQIFDARFIAGTASYRAYRFRWSGFPDSRPAIAIVRRGSGFSAYASWNGATAVTAWRVLAGAKASSLRRGAAVPRHGFETAIPIPAGAHTVAVQALGARGAVLATSLPRGVH